VLMAVGIAYEIEAYRDGFGVFVSEADGARASEHLARYEAEHRAANAPIEVRPEPPRYPLAWRGSLAYVLVLLAVGWAIARGIGPLDAYARGAADAALIRAGEWWRTITALTLHVDVAHLVANIAGGAWFGTLAGRRLGPGVAWLAIVLAAALANGLQAAFGPASHRSVGASTAVFAALGLITACSLRDHGSGRMRWAARWAPLVGGVLLLGWLGTAGENTDVIAHVLGFACGALVGWFAATPIATRLIARAPQCVAGLAALGLVVLAWLLAAR